MVDDILKKSKQGKSVRKRKKKDLYKRKGEMNLI